LIHFYKSFRFIFYVKKSTKSPDLSLKLADFP